MAQEYSEILPTDSAYVITMNGVCVNDEWRRSLKACKVTENSWDRSLDGRRNLNRTWGTEGV